MVNISFLSIPAILFYVLAAQSLRQRRIQLLWFLGTIAITLHAWVLYKNIVLPMGLNLGFFHAFSLIAWVIAVLLLFSLLRQPVENLIVVVFPIASLSIGLEIFFYTERILLFQQSFGVILHISSSIIAYSLLSISALQALFLAYQDYQLRHKHPGWVIKMLPPLQVMEKLLVEMIVLGFIFLTISLLSGVIFLEDIFAQHLVHKTVLSTIAWLVFGLLLWGNWQYGWRGKTIIRWNLGGFAVLMLAYFGSKMVLELILQY
ncbi:MAG: cytochrome c biogenesis protein CcsA [Thiomargarita sp.]|nr:cytochrome c biogenesis protein CcsA [Thiomargarita sp.]